MPLIRDDRGLSDLVESAAAEQVASGCTFTEGPVWSPAGYLLFSDIPNNRIHRWQPGQPLAVFREPSGQSNGLTFDRENRLLACEHLNRRVSRTLPDGTVETLADRYEGRRLNSPNDLCVHSSGAIYFTDPPYGVPRGVARDLDYQGVFRLAPNGTLTLLAQDFDRPNGIAFSPDERVLYIDDTTRMHVRAFDVAADGSLTNGRVFATYANAERHGADGLKVDRDGRVYATGGGGCYVWAPDGAWLGVLVLPEPPANVAWGDADRRTLYFTARTGVYRVRMKVAGLAAGRPPAG